MWPQSHLHRWKSTEFMRISFAIEILPMSSVNLFLGFTFWYALSANCARYGQAASAAAEDRSVQSDMDDNHTQETILGFVDSTNLTNNFFNVEIFDAKRRQAPLTFSA